MSRERENIRRMRGYTSGEQPTDAAAIKLNTNENPWPPAPAIADAIREFDADRLRRYPQPTADRFRRLAAALHNVASDNIIATRGGDELLRLVITTFVNPGEPIGMTEPTYSLYDTLASIQDCPVVKLVFENDWALPADFANRLNEANVKLTMIVNPHAPSGKLLGVDQVRQLAGSLDSLLLLDEAYVDFVDPEAGYDAMPLIGEFDNVIILRSLSKGYSLAGLRVGYGLGAPSLIRPMIEKTRDSYNLDVISQHIAEVALEHRDYAASTWQRVRDERRAVRAALMNFGWEIPESQANYLLATVNSGHATAESIYLGLKEAGILVRWFDHDGLRDKLRISIGTPRENARLIEALARLLG